MAANDAQGGNGRHRIRCTVIEVSHSDPSVSGMHVEPRTCESDATLLPSSAEAALEDGECEEVLRDGKAYVRWEEYKASSVLGKLTNKSQSATKLVNPGTLTTLKGTPPKRIELITATTLAGSRN